MRACVLVSAALAAPLLTGCTSLVGSSPLPPPTAPLREVGYIGQTLHLVSMGLSLQVTPMKAVGRVVRSKSLIGVDEVFYVAVRLRVQNTGNVSWGRWWKYARTAFKVFPADSAANFFPCGPVTMDTLWDKAPMMPNHISPGETAVGWITFCVKNSSIFRLELRDLRGNYVLDTCSSYASLCPIWRFQLE